MRRIMKQNCFDYDIRVSVFIYSTVSLCVLVSSPLAFVFAPGTALNAFVASRLLYASV